MEKTNPLINFLFVKCLRFLTTLCGLYRALTILSNVFLSVFQLKIPEIYLALYPDQILKKHKMLRIFIYPAGIYLLKINNRNTRKRCEICSKLIMKTPERRHWRHSGVFIVNFEHVSRLTLVFFCVFVFVFLFFLVNFEHYEKKTLCRSVSMRKKLFYKRVP